MKKLTPKNEIERIAPIAAVVAVLLVGALTLMPFLPAILWGIVLAIAIDPSYRNLTIRFGNHRAISAFLMGSGLFLLFIIPAVGLSRAFFAVLPDALTWLQRIANTKSHHAPEVILKVPTIGPHIASLWQSFSSDTSKIVLQFSSELKAALYWLMQESVMLGGFVLEFGVGIILSILLVYHGDRFIELSGKFLDRIGGQFARQIAALSILTVRRTVFGVLGAASAQTLVATFSYVIAGVPGWIILAGITFVLSLIQIGPVLIWLPMSIWLWSNDQTFMALFVFVWGLVVVNATDNIVRPMLVSKGSDLPAFLAFLGAIGGLFQWGIIGVFLGPVIVAVCRELILKWIEPETLSD